MACFRPLKGWRSRKLGKTGKRGIAFNVKEGYVDLPMQVPCGQCIGCRLERSRQWAVRCMHEASLYTDNAFITLTYDDEHLPKWGSLKLEDFQKFMKRLRRHIDGNPNFDRVRFYHCGEYGENTKRPHYHALLFGFDFPDKHGWMYRNDNPVWKSELLGELWPMGLHEIGVLNFDSAAYCARYIMKKVTGFEADRHYEVVDPDTGELGSRRPEYTTMSRRPGIGKDWFKKWGKEVYPQDEVIVRGRKMKPPKFYDAIYEIENPDGYEIIKRRRLFNRSLADETPERLAVREVVAESKMTERELT